MSNHTVIHGIYKVWILYGLTYIAKPFVSILKPTVFSPKPCSIAPVLYLYFIL